MKSTEGQIDRDSPAEAEAVMSTVCPDEDARREILRCLLQSIAFADSVAPEAWAVTLFNNRFRLNVGPVEALTCRLFQTAESTLPIIRVLTQGNLPEAVVQADAREADDLAVSTVSYSSIPVPRHVVALAASDAVELRKWIDQIQEAHHRYIKLALQTPSGGIRTSTQYKRTHSTGLIEYAKAFCTQPSEERSSVVDTDASDEDQFEYFEGRPIAIQTTRFERDEDARRACLSHYGYACVACGFNFGKTYGPIGEQYIQVHHLTPLATRGTNTHTDAIADLRPLCANCHAVAHFKNPPYSIDEIKAFLNQEPNHE